MSCDVEQTFNRNLLIELSIFNRSGFKASDQLEGQGFPWIGNGPYTLVREYFNARGNAGIEPQMGF